MEKDLFNSISRLLKQEKVLHKVVDEIQNHQQHNENDQMKDKVPTTYKTGDAASQAVDLNQKNQIQVRSPEKERQ